ncbi:uncharacterized protein sfi1 isoform X2 [Nelusetta ayraudi]|uniref:uncharacterized protein sfi1 isoform X2 n=1 Tax=Nelusetta ayraudi TaxID=303726 RepID=UPI003F6EB209
MSCVGSRSQVSQASGTTNVRKRDSGRIPSSSVNPADDVKHVRKSHTRKIPYKVGYTWNKGGRLKELRIRHLARKFLWIWMQNTFGRVLPQKAKSHYNSVILRRAFEGWRDEWWASMREWSLTTRAECHYKYHLCALTFQHWQVLVPLHKEKRKIVQSAQSDVDTHVMIQVLDRWKVFTEMRRKKSRMLQTALELNRLETLHSAWRLWQTRLRQQRVLHSSAERALNENALSLQKRTWLRWKSAHSAAASSQRENESKAALHFDLKEDCEEEDQRNRMARQHYYQHLMRAGLEALSRNATENKRHRLNSNIAVQHYCQTVTLNHWNLWKTHLDEAKDRRLQLLLEEHRTSVLCNFFHCWRDKLAELRHMRELAQRADHCFSDRTLALCFKSWSDFTLQGRLHKQRRQEAEGYNQQRRYAWAFYTWWSRAEEFRNQRLVERIAIQHQDRCKVRTAWKCWRRRMEQQREKQTASDHMYVLLETLSQRKENSMDAHSSEADQLTEIRFMEEQAQDHFQRLLQRKVFRAWRKATTYAVSKRYQQGEAVTDAQRSINQVRLPQSSGCWRKKACDANPDGTSMERARRHHESKLLFRAMAGWRNYHNQCHKNKIRKRQGNLLLKLKMYQKYFEQWKIKLQHRRRESEQTERALWHWSLTLQAKVLRSWSLWLAEQRARQEQAAREAQVYRDQLLREGVSYILTYAAQMSDLTTTLTQYSEEQRLRRLHRVVRSCAMRWKQQALAKPQKKREVRETQPKKTVTFCLTTTEFRTLSPCYSEEDEVEEHNNLRLTCDHCDQIGGYEALPQTPLNIYNQRQLDSTGEDALLPPSAFMTGSSENMQIDACSSGFGDGFQQPSTSPDTSSRETGETDSTLITELLSIQLDMKTYQQDKKQLQAWQKLRDVLKGWLQTSGKDDRMETKAVCEELQELEDRITRLAAELTERKPSVRLQVARVQHLHGLLSELPLNEAQQ